MSFPFIFPKYRKPFKVKVKEAIITAIILVIVILCVYLYLDSNVSRDYITSDSMLSVDTSYKSKFEKLVKKVEDGMQTGIPSHDDSGITLGMEIPVTPGSGDWASFPADSKTITKSSTYINMAGFSYSDTAAKELDRSIYNPFFLEQCVVYNPHGVVKFLDKYITVATGTYLAYKLGLDAGNDCGKMYRVTLSTGSTYDIIVIDTKGAGATEHVLSTPGYNKDGYVTLGHPDGANGFCLTEFYRLCTWQSQYGAPKYYPIRGVAKKGSNTDNGIDYPNTVTFKEDDFGKASGTGVAIHKLEPFSGDVVKFQQIVDPEATRIWEEVTKKYYDEGYAGKAVVYDKGGTVCTHQ